MSEVNISYYRKLFLKKVLGRSTASESELLDKYLLEHPESLSDFISYTIGLKNNIHSFNSDRAWNKIMPNKNEDQIFIHRLFSPVLKIAASILVLVFIGIYIYYTKSGHKKMYLANNSVGYEQILLPDNSKIILQNKSTLIVSTHFNDKKREVKLNGQAFFEISENKAKPFIITANELEIEVLGTSFNVNTDSFSTEIYVKTGLVEVSNIKNNKTLLSQSKGAKLIKNQFEVFDIKDENYNGWYTGVYSFENADLGTVVQNLNSYYGNKIKLLNSTNKCRLTAKFDRYTIDQVLEIIKLSCMIKINKINQVYQLQ